MLFSSTVFIYFLIIGCGYLSMDYIGTMITSTKQFVTDTKASDPVNDFLNFTDSVENNSVEHLNCHNKFMDKNSVYNNLIDTRVEKR